MGSATILALCQKNWGVRNLQPASPAFDKQPLFRYAVIRADNVLADRQIEPCRPGPVIGSVFILPSLTSSVFVSMLCTEGAFATGGATDDSFGRTPFENVA